MIVYATIKDHTMMLTPVAEQLRAAYLSNLKDGTTVKVEITKQRSKRTDAQLRAFWGWIIVVAKKALDDTGWERDRIPLCEEQVKRILYEKCAHVGEHGEVVPLSEQSVEQTIQFFENCASWLTNFGVFNTLDLDPLWREHIRK